MNTQIQTVLSLLAAGVLPFVAEYLNGLWKMDGKRALAVAGVLSGVLSLVAILLTSVLNNVPVQSLFTPQSLSLTFLLIYGLSQTEFQAIKDSMGWSSTANSQVVG